LIGVVEEKIVVDERLPGNYTEQVDESLGLVAHVAAHDFTAS